MRVNFAALSLTVLTGCNNPRWTQKVLKCEPDLFIGRDAVGPVRDVTKNIGPTVACKGCRGDCRGHLLVGGLIDLIFLEQALLIAGLAEFLAELVMLVQERAQQFVRRWEGEECLLLIPTGLPELLLLNFEFFVLFDVISDDLLALRLGSPSRS